MEKINSKRKRVRIIERRTYLVFTHFRVKLCIILSIYTYITYTLVAYKRIAYNKVCAGYKCILLLFSYDVILYFKFGSSTNIHIRIYKFAVYIFISKKH